MDSPQYDTHRDPAEADSGARSPEGTQPAGLGLYGTGSGSSRETALAVVAAELEAAKQAHLQAYLSHALNCPDPVGCEVRAWQALFVAESRR